MTFADDARTAFARAEKEPVVIDLPTAANARSMQRKLIEARRWFSPDAKKKAKEITVAVKDTTVTLTSKQTPDRLALQKALKKKGSP